MVAQSYLKQSLMAYNWSRSAVFSLESLPLVTVNRLFNKSDRPPEGYIENVQASMHELFAFDTSNILNGVYPARVLIPESPGAHLLRYLSILRDSVRVSRRRKERQHKDFSADSLDEYRQSGFPDYYLRNFHYQTDGYLSEKSAEIYDHQVEILFHGAANAMRRLALFALREKFSRSDSFHLLELASGAGSTTEQIAKTFPNAKITCVDLSPYYLKAAQKRLRDFPNIDFVQADASSLPFQDEQFDAALSVFLFHEIPKDVRLQVLQEAYRILKKGGPAVHVDSIQFHDSENLRWGVENFPKDFHEPFYKNYVQTPLEEQFLQCGLGAPNKEQKMLSKALWTYKGEESKGNSQ